MSRLTLEETGSMSGGVLHGVDVNGRRNLSAGALSAAGRDGCVMVAGEGRVVSDAAEVVCRAFEAAA